MALGGRLAFQAGPFHRFFGRLDMLDDFFLNLCSAMNFMVHESVP